MIALSLLLFSAPASANVIIPAIVGSWPLMLFALLPVIFIEALVLSLGFGNSAGAAFRASTWTNLASTIVGIPVATLLLSLHRDDFGVAVPIDNFAKRFKSRWDQFHAAIFFVPFGYEGDGPRTADDWRALRWVEPLSEFVILLFFCLCSWAIEASIAARYELLNESRLISGMLAANAISYSCVLVWFIIMHISNMRESLAALRKPPLPTLKAQREAAESAVDDAEASPEKRAA